VSGALDEDIFQRRLAYRRTQDFSRERLCDLSRETVSMLMMQAQSPRDHRSVYVKALFEFLLHRLGIRHVKDDHLSTDGVL
jgi:hypothetical protein